MEVLILVGIGVVIWLLLRKQGLKVALVESDDVAPPEDVYRAPRPGDVSKLMPEMASATRALIIAELVGNPRAKASGVEASVRAYTDGRAGGIFDGPGLGLFVHHAVFYYKLASLSCVSVARMEAPDASAADMARVLSRTFRRDGMLPRSQNGDVRETLELLVSAFWLDTENVSAEVMEGRLRRYESKLIQAQRQIDQLLK